MKHFILMVALVAPAYSAPASVTGERKLWHKVTLTWTGPQASETGSDNPFTDYRLDVTFTHKSGGPSYRVPRYFAADGNAAASSATAGNRWRVHFAPDKTGEWSYKATMVKGAGVAVNSGVQSAPVGEIDGDGGTLKIAASDKKGADYRAKGRLAYVGASPATTSIS